MFYNIFRGLAQDNIESLVYQILYNLKDIIPINVSLDFIGNLMGRMPREKIKSRDIVITLYDVWCISS